jgi:hypothetical protein
MRSSAAQVWRPRLLGRASGAHPRLFFVHPPPRGHRILGALAWSAGRLTGWCVWPFILSFLSSSFFVNPAKTTPLLAFFHRTSGHRQLGPLAGPLYRGSLFLTVRPCAGLVGGRKRTVGLYRSFRHGPSGLGAAASLSLIKPHAASPWFLTLEPRRSQRTRGHVTTGFFGTEAPTPPAPVPSPPSSPAPGRNLLWGKGRVGSAHLPGVAASRHNLDSTFMRPRLGRAAALRGLLTPGRYLRVEHVAAGAPHGEGTCWSIPPNSGGLPATMRDVQPLPRLGGPRRSARGAEPKGESRSGYPPPPPPPSPSSAARDRHGLHRRPTRRPRAAGGRGAVAPWAVRSPTGRPGRR